MSTGENINANGAKLTADMVRGGFQKFPQSTVVQINPANFAEIEPIQIMSVYPFTVVTDQATPIGELWYIDVNTGALLGRIINFA
ncbi:MAG TPA: hypothetical protein VF772_17540 [Terriglobales bacterium]